MSRPLNKAFRPDLGAGGVVALLTPAENPTAEPELSVLLPPDVNLLTARMYAPDDDMGERLRAYGRGLSGWLAPFGDAPLDAVAFACTGSSYLLPPDERPEAPLMRNGAACPVVCAAGALEAALASLGASRITLVSPYPAGLTVTAASYWRARGFDIVAVHDTPAAEGGHPIYSKTASTLLGALRGALTEPTDAVVVMGTGAPSLAALSVASLETSTPILSSNLCTAWNVANVLSGRAQPIGAWLAAEAPWRTRLAQRFPTVIDRLRACPA